MFLDGFLLFWVLLLVIDIVEHIFKFFVSLSDWLFILVILIFFIHILIELFTLHVLFKLLLIKTLIASKLLIFEVSSILLFSLLQILIAFQILVSFKIFVSFQVFFWYFSLSFFLDSLFPFTDFLILKLILTDRKVIKVVLFWIQSIHLSFDNSMKIR